MRIAGYIRKGGLGGSSDGGIYNAFMAPAMDMRMASGEAAILWNIPPEVGGDLQRGIGKTRLRIERGFAKFGNRVSEYPWRGRLVREAC